MIAAPIHRCQGSVYNGFNFRACGNKAKVERDGKHYCGTHDPEAVKAKRDARNAEWTRQANERAALAKSDQAARALRDHKAACFDDLLAALLYYRDECSGAEPSLSVFHKMLDEAVEKATQGAKQ